MAEKPASDHWIGLFASESSWLFWSDGQRRRYINMNLKVGTENLNYEFPKFPKLTLTIVSLDYLPLDEMAPSQICKILFSFAFTVDQHYEIYLVLQLWTVIVDVIDCFPLN